MKLYDEINDRYVEATKIESDRKTLDEWLIEDGEEQKVFYSIPGEFPIGYEMR